MKHINVSRKVRITTAYVLLVLTPFSSSLFAMNWKSQVGGYCSSLFTNVLKNPTVACILGLGGAGAASVYWYFRGSNKPIDEVVSQKIGFLMEALKALVDPLRPSVNVTRLRVRHLPGTNVTELESVFSEIERIANELGVENEINIALNIINDSSRSDEVVMRDAGIYINNQIAPLFVQGNIPVQRNIGMQRNMGTQVQSSSSPVRSVSNIQPSLQEGSNDQLPTYEEVQIQPLLGLIEALEKVLMTSGLSKGDQTIGELVQKMKKLVQFDPRLSINIENLMLRLDDYLGAQRNTPARQDARASLMNRIQELKNELRSPGLLTQSSRNNSLTVYNGPGARIGQQIDVDNMHGVFNF